VDHATPLLTAKKSARDGETDRGPCAQRPIELVECYERQFMTRFGTKRIASGRIAFDLCGPVGDQYFEQSAGRVYENRLWLAVLSAMRNEAKTIVDVGANIGFTASLAARKVPHARIIAIEPSPTAYECLCRTIATNDLANVTAVHAFISSTDRLVHFKERTGNLAASGLAGPDRLPVDRFPCARARSTAH
jgi:hypothetical protein